MRPQKAPSYLFPLLIIGMVFFILGFGVGINGFLIPYMEKAFQLSTGASYLLLTATFAAYVIFGAPSGYILKKLGYKKSLVVALLVVAAGMLLFVPSAKMQSFAFFLVATFIVGTGSTLLQAAVNPYVTICGPEEKAAQRMCMMGIMNKSAWFLGPMFLSLFLSVSKDALEQNKANIGFLREVIQNNTLPFYLAATVIAALALFIAFVNLPEIKAVGEEADEANESEDVRIANKRTSIWQFPHLLLGVLALFIYVGVENLPMASVIGFAEAAGLENPEAYSAIVPIGLVAGYIISIFLLQVMNQTKALVLFCCIALAASVLLIFLPVSKAIYCLAGLGFAHSLMWGAIWALAISKLGKFTKTGSSFLVMGIVGGAVIPLIFGFLVDAFKTVEKAAPADYQQAYWIFIPCYLFILWYAVAGHKVGLKSTKN